METPKTNPSDSVAAGPRWLLLNTNNYDDDDSNYSSAAAAAAKTTAAASCTSTGLPFTVSFTVAAPPAVSTIHGHWIGGDNTAGTSSSSNYDYDDYYDYYYSRSKDNPELQIIAAHDDAVLIELIVPAGPDSYSATDGTVDYFLYDAASGRPSLFLLPGCHVSMLCERDEGARHVPTRTTEPRNLGAGSTDTGILRRGGDGGEVVVAQLEVVYDKPPYSMAELCVLRTGGRDWELRRVPIVHHEGDKGKVVWTEIDAVVPVGTRFMCWVDYLSGMLVCDMAAVVVATTTTANLDANPKLILRYVPLPPEARHHEAHEYEDDSDRRQDRRVMQYCRSLAAAGSGDAVRLVSVAPRCCCGGPGRTTCERSSSAFNVTTWTLRLTTGEMDEEPMAWVKDGVIDCDELWQQPMYDGLLLLPRVVLKYPVVSADDPEVVCFALCEEKTVWMVEINTRSKALVSVIRRDIDGICYNGDVLAAKLHWK